MITQRKFFYDLVDEGVKEVKVMGEGKLDGREVLAVRWGEFTEWVNACDVHENPMSLLHRVKSFKETERVKRLAKSLGF